MNHEAISGSSTLTTQEINTFHQQGYLGPIDLYDRAVMKNSWRANRTQVFDRTMAVYPNVEATTSVSIANYDRHLDIDYLAAHVCHPGIVGRLAGILGPDILCWRSEFFPKYPGDEGTDWHQADTFAHASGKPQVVWPSDEKFGGAVTVWTAFTDATIEMGCLQFIPGTHQTMFYDEMKGMHYDPASRNKTEKDGVKRGFLGYDYRSLQKDPNWKPNESDAVSMVMRAGQFVIFWSTLMHASHPHLGKTKDMRLGFASRYVPTSVKIYPDTESINEYGDEISLEKYGAVLVSGTNVFTHNRIRTHTTRGMRFPVYQTSAARPSVVA
jgi:non-haem Fe2+, alpha-ketoglutarate-dependent halogenase